MIKVQKADGSFEEFDENKIRDSLQRSGADEQTISYVIDHVSDKVSEGMHTDEIFGYVFDPLKGKNQTLMGKYNLKRAIMDLGPSGYPFEQFVAGILARYGYTTKTNQIVSGLCVSHEIDIIAQKDNKKIMIECKFHNRTGTKSDVRTALYTHARYLDVYKKNSFDQHWLVTNTKITSEATTYALCVGMKVVAWNYPHDFSLRELIERSSLHPITSLQTISSGEKKELLKKGIIFVRDWEEQKKNPQ